METSSGWMLIFEATVHWIVLCRFTLHRTQRYLCVIDKNVEGNQKNEWNWLPDSCMLFSQHFPVFWNLVMWYVVLYCIVLCWMLCWMALIYSLYSLIPNVGWLSLFFIPLALVRSPCWNPSSFPHTQQDFESLPPPQRHALWTEEAFSWWWLENEMPVKWMIRQNESEHSYLLFLHLVFLWFLERKKCRADKDRLRKNENSTNRHTHKWHSFIATW